MKKFKNWGFFTLLGLFICLSMPSCKTGEGCDAQTKYAVETDKDGNMSTKRGKSNLFSKKERKRNKR